MANRFRSRTSAAGLATARAGRRPCLGSRAPSRAPLRGSRRTAGSCRPPRRSRTHARASRPSRRSSAAARRQASRHRLTGSTAVHRGDRRKARRARTRAPASTRADSSAPTRPRPCSPPRAPKLPPQERGSLKQAGGEAQGLAPEIGPHPDCPRFCRISIDVVDFHLKKGGPASGAAKARRPGGVRQEGERGCAIPSPDVVVRFPIG